jgi:hypothetical protein
MTRSAEVMYEFTSQQQNARTWLASQGFEFKLDAADTSRSRFTLDARGLNIETLRPAEPMIFKANLDVAQPARLILSWGVTSYPAGANWDRGVNNEPIMVITFFGNEQLPGGLFLPPSPYFIGFFVRERTSRRGDHGPLLYQTRALHLRRWAASRRRDHHHDCA